MVDISLNQNPLFSVLNIIQGKDGMGAQNIKTAAVYARVSTRNGQSLENQPRELRAVASRHGWKTIETFVDQGISGTKGRDQRPGLNDLLRGVVRKDFDVVAERIHAGLAKAKEEGTKSGEPIGRPEVYANVRNWVITL